MNSPDTALISKLSALPTAAISDALDKLGLPGSALGIMPLFDGAKLAGPAYTIRYAPLDPVEPGTVGDYIDDVPQGAVVVLDNAARTDCTVWGDILTAVAHHKGLGGTVISGVCRDTSRALALKYPIYSVGKFMRTGKDRVQVAEMGGAVSIGGVMVRAGDILVGDNDGVVAIPAERGWEVADLAQRISDVEDRILEDALKEGSLRAARKKHGYHQLQEKAQ